MKKLNLLLLLGQVLIILFSWRFLPPELPLFYSRPWGKNQISSPFGLLILPTISLIIFLINLTLALIIPKEEQLLIKMLLLGSLFFGLVCLITLIKIIVLIT